MKRWITVIAVLILLAITLCLFMPVHAQPDFEGEWYSADEAELYIFRDGIINCQTHFYMESEEDHFSGAYIFNSNKMAIFVSGIEALSDVQELYLVKSLDGEVLNDSADGSGNTYFYRSQEAAMSTSD